MKAPLEQILQKEQIMVIDGSMSTALERLGADLNNELWTAMTLVRQPELVRQVHIGYFRAGADCGITCSYQATIPGLMKHGCSLEEAEKIIARSVHILMDAREEWWTTEGEAAGRAYLLCLAGVGPYGAYLANGAEYTGRCGMIAHAAAKTDHPVRQSLWGWGEVCLDTFIICAVTAFTIIITGSHYTSDATSGALTTIAFTSAYGAVGGKLTAISIAVFAWTTIIGMYYTCEKSVNYTFGDTPANKKVMPLYMLYYLLPCVIFYNIEAEALWAFTDVLSAIYVLITVFIIVAKHKEIFRLFDDFWKRYLPAKERGEEPPIVSFDCREP